MRVVVADDAAVVRLLVVRMLERAGHEVVGEAATGEETIRLYSEQRPDVLVIDGNMPNVNGFAAARAIRAIDPTVRIVIASVLANESRLREVDAVGASFLAKPFAAEALIAAIERTDAAAPPAQRNLGNT